MKSTEHVPATQPSVDWKTEVVSQVGTKKNEHRKVNVEKIDIR